MRVLVTGASGFIGSAIIQELIANGHEVRGLVRSSEAATALRRQGVEAIQGSIEHTAILRQAGQQMDGVVHTAFFHSFAHAGWRAKLRIMFGGHFKHAPVRFMKAAVQTDQHVIETMGNLLSSSGGSLVIAMPTMTMTAGRLALEEHAADVQSVGGPRAASEHTALAMAQRGVHASIVRLPPIVYGEGDRGGLLPSLIQSARKAGKSAYIDDGSNRWASIHRLDAARVFRLALEKGNGSSRFHAVADEGIAFRKIAGYIGDSLQLPTESLTTEQGNAHFSWLSSFAATDNPVSADATMKSLNWRPEQPSLQDEWAKGYYIQSSRQR
ncbi:SDR family oxidoreductase [Paenibacillus wenxiniae]|uniref:SDR family oxidoreductase n=1 Tax=Paenibacillus wenxiniae TaxID=1636843 RepID=A0ABW4RPK0_9BACL